MKRPFLRISHSCRNRWPILSILSILVLAVSSGQDTSAQDVSQNDIFLPLVSGQTAATRTVNTDRVEAPTVQFEDGHEHTGIGHIPEDGRFTANDGGTQSWPPQVKYIDEVEWNNTVSAAAIELENTLSAAAAVTEQENEIRELLGERYTFISAHPIRKKGVEGMQGQRVTYFSYSNNITIEAKVRDGDVTSVETFAASDWQPPLRQNEVEAAIEIARQYWQTRGNDRVSKLQGFTIQTFQPEGAGVYYDTRMTYVSFHADETAAPELLTWVDLTNETIFQAAIDHGHDNGGVQHVH